MQWLAVCGTCGRMADVCAVPVVLVRATALSCAMDGARAGATGPASGGRSLGQASRLAEQEIEEGGRVCQG